MFKKYASAVTVVALIAAPMGTGAIAQEKKITLPNCDCQISGSSATGKIVRTTGEVYISSANGYNNGATGDTFPIGSEVATGALSSAQVTIGNNCRVNLSSNALLTTAIQQNNQMCVKVASSAIETGSSTQQFGNDALTFLIGTGIFGALWWGNRDGDNDPNRASQ